MLKKIVLFAEGIAVGVLGTLLVQTLMEAPSEEVVVEVVASPEPEVDYTGGCGFEAPTDFNSLVEEIGEEFDINPRAIALTIWKESGCFVDAQGSSGEIGLMQINPSVWATTLRDNGFDDLSDPRTNMRAGAWILGTLKARGYTDKGILRRYNGSGPKARRYAAAQVETYRAMWGSDLEI